LYQSLQFGRRFYHRMTPDDAASKKKTAAPGKRRRLQSGGAVFGRFHQLGREEAYRGTGGAIKWQTTSD
jgi:hypothetical protein